MRENRKLWDAWSEDFQAAWNADAGEGELPPAPIHYGPGFSEEKRLDPLPELEGAAVLELGCGGGQASVGFAREGADHVVGVDVSTEQLTYARRLGGTYGVEDRLRFLAGDVTALPLGADRFDLAFSSWVFQMVSDLEACFGEAARVLRPGGTLVFAVPHPYYELFDPETGELERSYFDDAPERKSIGDLEPRLTVYHHTVGEIHRALVGEGFTVERLWEPGTGDPEAYREQWSHKPELMATVPPTLVAEASLE
ncbi:MAG: class I SAM-dependent methyltransferase [Haloferacaceae archaeon]